MNSNKKNELLKQLKKEVFGMNDFGFLDEDVWSQFIKDNFTRSGTIDGMNYSKELNERLSTAALLQVVETIEKKITNILKDSGGSEISQPDS